MTQPEWMRSAWGMGSTNAYNLDTPPNELSTPPEHTIHAINGVPMAITTNILVPRSDTKGIIYGNDCPSHTHHPHHHGNSQYSLGLHATQFFGHDWGIWLVKNHGVSHVILCMDILIWRFGESPKDNPKCRNAAGFLLAKARQSNNRIKAEWEKCKNDNTKNGTLLIPCSLCSEQMPTL